MLGTPIPSHPMILQAVRYDAQSRRQVGCPQNGSKPLSKKPCLKILHLCRGVRAPWNDATQSCHNRWLSFTDSSVQNQQQQNSLTINTSSMMAPMSNPITYSKLSAMAQTSPSWNNVATTYPKSAPNQYIGDPDTMALGP
jgi:hypothetical protein